MPTLVQWLDEYARMAVQIFLVVSGFLFAAKFAPAGVPVKLSPLPVLLQRYTRLVVPYSAALLLAVACSAVASVWMEHRPSRRRRTWRSCSPTCCCSTTC
jgi:peptidoglycan/LPS O-acetylase OafA/YrhL